MATIYQNRGGEFVQVSPSTEDFTELDSRVEALENTGPYVLPVASETSLGGVKVDGVSVVINPAGVITAPAGVPVSPAEELPQAPGIAAVGVSAKYAREDHKHPAQDIPVATEETVGTVKPGVALRVDSGGVLSVDPSVGTISEVNEVRKGFGILIPLQANKNFYVNGTTGSDTLDEGRGESEGRPFKTIQACYNYVADNYNLSRYTVTIHVADGIYSPFSAGNFTSTTGGIVISARDAKFADDFPVVISGQNSMLVSYTGNGALTLKNLKYKQTLTNDARTFLSSVFCGGPGSLIIDRFFLDTNATDNFSGNKFFRTLWLNGGNAYIQNNSSNGACYINSNVSDSSYNIVNSIFYSSLGSSLIFRNALSEELSSIVCSGKAASFAVSNNGLISRNTNNSFPLKFSGSFVGKRYNSVSGGKIDTSNSGPDYFPGDTPGTVEASTYSWYK